MSYQMADIVRITDNNYMNGLYEIVGPCDSAVDPDGFDYDYTATRDFCDTEVFVKREDLILVCRVLDRDDLEEDE